MTGTKDPFSPMFTLHEMFTTESAPVQVSYEDGHKFPRSLEDSEYHKLTEFIRKQYIVKNKTDEGFELKFEHFHFERK